MTEPDLSEFETLIPDRGPQCSISEARKLLSPAKRAKLDSALDRQVTAPGKRRIPDNSISQWLLKQGIEVSAHTVGRHRRQECRCGRSK